MHYKMITIGAAQFKKHAHICSFMWAATWEWVVILGLSQRRKQAQWDEMTFKSHKVSKWQGYSHVADLKDS